MIQSERITVRPDPRDRGGTGAGAGAARGDYVLYWMQRSQREECNHALEYAVDKANELGLPVLVLFVLTPDYPEAVLRHYRFMLEGIRETARSIRARGIGFILRVGSPPEMVERYARNASLLVGDRGYLRHTRGWRTDVASRVNVPYREVETDVVVPVETASEKEEYTAGTLRPKIHRRLFQFLVPLEGRKAEVPWRGTLLPDGGDAGDAELTQLTEDTEDVEALLTHLAPDGSVGTVEGVRGGESAAHELLERFIEQRLAGFAELRNDPAEDYTSGLSPYLHFGQMSPLTIALAAMERADTEIEGFLEELVVRRELAFNFTWYDEHYDSFECLPRWARETLEAHEQDRRDPSYDGEQLERAQTHDPYWNAAQRELVITGRMHGYMRMYWGKKILEWTPSVRIAFARALYLNNRYALDGRDPNSYAGIAWCFGKHDRAWQQRRIFGKVRYMNDRGLERKFKIREYVDRVNRLPG